MGIARDRLLTSLNNDGTVKWKGSGSDLKSDHGVAYLPEQKIFGNQYYKICTFDTSGNPIQEVDLLHQPQAAPVIGPDGSFYIKTYPASIHAYSKTGILKWSKKHTEGTNSIAIGKDGTLYYTCQDNYLYATLPDGTTKWTINLGEFTRFGIALDDEDNIYVGEGKSLRAYSSDGRQKWRYYINDYISTPTIIGDDSILYFGTRNGKIYALSTANEYQWSFQANGEINQFMTLYNHHLIASSQDSTLYSIYCTSSDLAPKCWSSPFKDRKNTSNAFSPYFPQAEVQSDSLFVTPGETVTLDASTSIALDGGDLHYEWSCLDKPNSDEVLITNANQAIANATIDCPDFGTYSFGVTVTDNSGNQSSSVIFVTCGLKWIKNNLENPFDGVTIGPDGTLYYGRDWYHMNAIDPEGNVKWDSNIGDAAHKTFLAHGKRFFT